MIHEGLMYTCSFSTLSNAIQSVLYTHTYTTAGKYCLKVLQKKKKNIKKAFNDQLNLERKNCPRHTNIEIYSHDCIWSENCPEILRESFNVQVNQKYRSCLVMKTGQFWILFFLLLSNDCRQTNLPTANSLRE